MVLPKKWEPNSWPSMPLSQLPHYSVCLCSQEVRGSIEMDRTALSMPCSSLAPCLATPRITSFQSHPPTAREPTMKAVLVYILERLEKKRSFWKPLGRAARLREWGGTAIQRCRTDSQGKGTNIWGRGTDSREAAGQRKEP